ncbi:Sister chromatid cohesion protein 2 [Geranomyces variabilis]|uniref:Sister chromatid cohesion protein n=1 Tax=Geranomyces variabilis TaxID=109894 RepID=A0AAD5TJX7_9FUNG|nr:Sister chromatid cohesion protein 2 [Geranomyces variabilis]
MPQSGQPAGASSASHVSPPDAPVHRHVLATRQQPLTSLSPVIDAGGLLPTLAAFGSLAPTPLDEAEQALAAHLAGNADATMSGANGLLAPALLATVNSMLAQVDLGYLHLSDTSFERREEPGYYRDAESAPPEQQPPSTPSHPRAEGHHAEKPIHQSSPVPLSRAPDTAYGIPHSYPTPTVTNGPASSTSPAGPSAKLQLSTSASIPHTPTKDSKRSTRDAYSNQRSSDSDPQTPSLKRPRSKFAGVVIEIGCGSPLASPRTKTPLSETPTRTPTPNIKPEFLATPIGPPQFRAALEAQRTPATPANDPAVAMRNLALTVEAILHEHDSLCDADEPGMPSDTKYFDGELISADGLKTLHKYLRRSTGSHNAGRIGQSIEKGSLKRLSRLLEGRMKDGEFLQVFDSVGQKDATGAPKAKRRKTTNADESFSSTVAEDDGSSQSASLFETKLRNVIRRVETSLTACRVALKLFHALTSDGKQEDFGTDSGFSENLVKTGVNLVKTQLHDTVYGILDLLAKDGDEITPAVRMMQTVCDQVKVKSMLSSLISKIDDIMNVLAALLDSEILDEGIVIPIVFMVVPSFFVDSGDSTDSVGLHQIQMGGISLCRTIFSRHPAHRTFILDEISVNLIRLANVKRSIRAYRLPDGKSIQMITALILHLVHSCFSSDSVRAISKEVLSALSESEEPAQLAPPPAVAPPNKKGKLTAAQQREAEAVEKAAREKLQAEISILTKFTQTCKANYEAARQCAHYLMKFLLSRSGQPIADTATPKEKIKGRRTVGSTTETEYRAVLENLFKDLLVLSGTPEWPAADIAITVFSRLLMQTLDDTKKQGDTAIRALAVEWLGAICARLRTRQPLRPEIESALPGCEAQVAKIEFGPALDEGSAHTLWTLQKWVADWLESGQTNDLGLKAAQNTFVVLWGAALPMTGNESWTPASRDIIRKLTIGYGALLTSAVPSRSDILPSPPIPAPPDIASTAMDARPSIQSCVGLLAIRQPLYHSFDLFFLRIAAALDSDVVTLRAKALKAMQEIFQADPGVLALGNTRKVIQARIMDQSTSVRDAAIDVVGKFLVAGGSEMLITEYYPMLAERILDVGTNVRKRIVRLLKDIYPMVCAAPGPAHNAIAVDIPAKLMLRLTDEEDTVKDLAFKALQEFWLSPFAGAPSDSDTSGACNSEAFQKDQAWGTLPSTVRNTIRDRAMIMVAAVAHLKTAPDAFSGFLERSRDAAGKAARQDLLCVCRSLIECLMEEILCLEEKGDKTAVMNALALVNQICKVYPALASSHVKTLHTYLGSASGTSAPTSTDSVDQRSKLYVIMILQNVIPVMQMPDLRDLTAVETDLAQALSSGSQQLVAVAVPCLCSIVTNVTKRHEILTKIVRKCIEFVQKIKKSVLAGNTVPEPGWRGAWRSLLLLSSFVRHFDFDTHRAEFNESAQQDLNAITTGSIVTFSCGLLLFFTGPQVSDATKSMSLGSLGNLFIAYPRLMLRTDSRALMDMIFASDSTTLKISLLRAFGDYLHTEHAREAKKKKEEEAQPADAGVDIKVLIGNADEMGDAGISSSIMQTYLAGILLCLLDKSQQMTRTALDLIELIVEQGLVHPLLCMPAIVAMEANVAMDVRDRACRLHADLNDKHASFIHSKNNDCIKSMFKYSLDVMTQQTGKTPHADPLFAVSGYLRYQIRKPDGALLDRNEAKLGRMFGIVQPKRPRRNEFLVGLVKLMDLDASQSVTPEQTALCRFVADNLAILEYKTQEEVLQVIYHAYRILSVTAESLLREIERRESEGSEEHAGALSLESLARGSISMSILLALKTYLQTEYGLSAARVSSFRPNDGPKSSEKPAVKTGAQKLPVGWEMVPFASRPMAGEADWAAQCRVFKELMHEDYVTGFADHGDDEATSPVNAESATASVEIAVDDAGAADAVPEPRKRPPPISTRRPSSAATKKRGRPPASSKSSAAATPRVSAKRKKKSVAKNYNESSGEEEDDSRDADWK